MEEQFAVEELVQNCQLGSQQEVIVHVAAHQVEEKIVAMNVEIEDTLLVIVVDDDAAGKKSMFLLLFSGAKIKHLSKRER